MIYRKAKSFIGETVTEAEEELEKWMMKNPFIKISETRSFMVHGKILIVLEYECTNKIAHLPSKSN